MKSLNILFIAFSIFSINCTNLKTAKLLQRLGSDILEKECPIKAGDKTSDLVEGKIILSLIMKLMKLKHKNFIFHIFYLNKQHIQLHHY